MAGNYALITNQNSINIFCVFLQNQAITSNSGLLNQTF